MTMIHDLVAGVGPFFLLLGLLIFVHEGGHFLTAKFFNVRVETFSLGFGKKILSFKKGETTYALSLIPLGGYVKMFGDDPSVVIDEAERPRAFLHKPIYQRFAIVLAGPLTNLLFAIILFTAIGGVGEDMPSPFVGDIQGDSVAFKEGFRPGDKVLSIDGVEVPTWNHVKETIEANPERTLEVSVARPGQTEPIKISAAVSLGANENIFSSHRQVGQVPGLVAESRSTLVGLRDPKSPAAVAGVQSLDLITGLDGEKISYWRDLQPRLHAAALKGETVSIEVRDLDHEDKSEATRTLTIKFPEGAKENLDLPSALGFEAAELYIYRTSKNSPAEHAGIEAKDRLLKVGGQEVHQWSDVLARVNAYDEKSDGLEFTLLRAGAEKVLKIKPEMTKLMNPKGQEEHRYTVGIRSGYFPVNPDPVYYRVKGVIPMLANGLRETAQWTEFVVMSMVRLIQGEVSAKNVGGVITIGRVASHSFAAGLGTFLKTMAIISINLFLLNLLPIPILDGGHLVFYAIEGLKGTPISMRKMELAQQIGLTLLMFLMVFAFYNDITNWLANRG